MRTKKELYMQIINKSLKITGFTVILISILSVSAQAIWLGQSQINPYLEVQEIYDSNVFRVNNDEIKESDWTTVISPGIHAEFPTAKDAQFRFLADYRANIKLYGNHGDSKIDPGEELNTIEHRLGGEAQLNLASGLSFSSGYALNLISTAPDYPGDVREKYADHGILAKASYSFVDRYEVQLGYSGHLIRFDEKDLQIRDFTLHRFDATFFYRLFPSLSLLGGGGYAMVERKDPFSNNTEYLGFGGVRFEATSQLTGLLKAGVVSKQFDKEGFKDKTDAYVSGEVQAEFSEDSRMAATVYRGLYETGADTAVANGGYYLATGGKATVNYTLGALPNLSFNGFVLVEQKEYPEAADDRKDDTFEAGVGAEYKFLKYFVIGAHYKHSQIDSTLDSSDYSQEMGILSIRAIL